MRVRLRFLCGRVRLRGVSGAGARGVVVSGARVGVDARMPGILVKSGGAETRQAFAENVDAVFRPIVCYCSRRRSASVVSTVGLSAGLCSFAGIIAGAGRICIPASPSRCPEFADVGPAA